MKCVIFFFSSLLAVTCLSQIIHTELSNPIDSLIENEKKLDFCGSVLVAKGDRIIHQKDYGLEPGNSYSYWIGSLSKQFCATAILRLQEMNLLSVSEPVSNYIEEIPLAKTDITFHQLLTHTSGLGDNYSADGITNRNEAIKKILSMEREYPGEYSYSSDGYQLLALLVEIISGKSYEEFLQSEFFEPLAMTQTGFSGDQKRWNALTTPWTKKRKKSPQEWSLNYGYKGATGVITSTVDLMKWKSALFQGQVLNKETMALLFKSHVQKSGDLYYGYGWNIINTKRGKEILHSGSDDFIHHNSSMRIFEEANITIIVLDNQGQFKNSTKSRILVSKLIPIVFEDI